ncbi:hypothetical protein YN1HA_1370 [Sulfurisphaera ohwakuensis]
MINFNTFLRGSANKNGMVKEIYKERVKVLTDLWSKILQDENLARGDVIELLKESYEEKGIKPIRGFKAEDLYEKELISLYVVGKDGLGLFDDYRDVFNRLFSFEINYDDALKLILENKPLDAYEKLDRDKGNVAKSLRLAFIETVFSFKPEEILFNAIRNLNNTALDDLKHTAVSFSRFYTAFKIAEGIAEKSIRDKMSLEVMKKVIAINIGIKYPLPRQEYISLIASEVFNINQKILKRIFS